MKRRERSAPIWLFSFVDLAFLLLIAFTQLVPDPTATETALASIELPRIEQVEPEAAAGPDSPVWQLRVHPLAAASDPAQIRTPYELVEPGARPAAESPADAERAVGTEDLRARLALLHARSLPRPLLAPHRDARSEDLLVAVSLLEQVWQSGRGVTVQPTPAISAERAISAANRAR
jgi:hypothetical protein